MPNTDAIEEDRSKTDKSLNAERAKATESLTPEKGEKQTPAEKRVTKVLENERKVTDRNLFEERTSTDNQLQSEINEHSRTKHILTSREELLAIVGHDLRNPVAAASSYASLILNKTDIDEDVRSFARAIKRINGAALRLISDLMDMERYDQGKWKFVIADCSAQDLIEETIEHFSFEAQEKNIQFTMSLSKEIESFKSDHDRLIQVLGNLVSNAINFSPRNSQINLAASVSQIDIQFSVKDEGPGIPEEKKTQIFERFAQIESKNRNGLGLGLYISKTLITGLNGRMWIESSLGKGSTFYFSLPLN
jgi:signal transduction histidine kinase